MTESPPAPGAGLVPGFGIIAHDGLLVAPALGASVSLAGLRGPPAVETVVKLFRGAASPCALVALDLFLSARRGGGRRDVSFTATLVALKLFAKLAIT